MEVFREELGVVGVDFLEVFMAPLMTRVAPPTLFRLVDGLGIVVVSRREEKNVGLVVGDKKEDDIS